jgi:hypothetical protein
MGPHWLDGVTHLRFGAVNAYLSGVGTGWHAGLLFSHVP